MRIAINTDNDAFRGNPVTEVARILYILAGRIEKQGMPALGDGWHLLDKNGNGCGICTSEPWCEGRVELMEDVGVGMNDVRVSKQDKAAVVRFLRDVVKFAEENGRLFIPISTIRTTLNRIDAQCDSCIEGVPPEKQQEHCGGCPFKDAAGDP